VGPLIARRALPRPRSARGFTLIEILVVLVILALAGGLAAAALAPDERGATLREAQRFAGAVEYAAARAQSRGETLGVSASGGTLQFWRRDDADLRWHPVADDVLVSRTLPAPLTAAAVAYAGQRVGTDVIVPLRASGRNEPFVFVVGTSAWRVILAADPLSRVTLDGPTAVAP
jgi:general secretion pathway protein H